MPAQIRVEKTCIIADDLTGAADAAAAFASRGLAAEVFPGDQWSATPAPGVLRSEGLAQRALDARVFALCTGTRDTTPEVAVDVLHRIAGSSILHAGTRLFKKIDSVFRGNTLVEIAAALAAFPQHFAVIAPAFPALGRRCVNGLLHLEDLDGVTSQPLRQRFREAGIDLHWLAPQPAAAPATKAMHATLAVGRRGIFCEAATDADLETIVHAAEALGWPILWIGSAGLAHALAAASASESRAKAPELPAGTLLVFTGSNHPVSERQLAFLRRHHTVADWPAIHPAAAADVRILRIERLKTTVEQMREAVHGIHAGSVSCLLMNGGDTALAVCQALGITSLRVEGEFAPGIAFTRAVGGRFDGRPVILKSGGFGKAELLSRIADRTTERREAIA